ncbi:MAG: hypothetical protein Unbinned2514contig1001_44 [Prokaryotic dsDNA virus sp.]|nr:MAG: hypothetical protein Unbinned2514contig1001_44 [Prokaryotic dsDNA virus sp.]|tara:strand:- start:5794 stop:7779 length:1986 start_codon:yes stop_codon:yes gene_type:complete
MPQIKDEYLIQVKTKDAKKSAKELKEVDKSIGGMSNTAKTAAKALGAAGLGFALVNIGKSSISAAAQFESLKTRLTAMTGSVKEGTRLFEEFNKIAATTPFQVANVVEAGATLKAFGVDAQNMIKPVADLAAFMGVDVVEAASAMGRAFAGGAGAADMLRDRGVLNLIKDFKGIEDLSKITLPEFRQAMEDAFTDPEAGIAGATTLLSKTFNGAMSNMQDKVTNASAALGDLLMPAAKDTMGFMGSLAENTEEFFKQLAESELATATRQLKEMGVAAEDLAILQNLVNMEKHTDAILNNNDRINKSLRSAKDLTDDQVLALGAMVEFETKFVQAGAASRSVTERRIVLNEKEKLQKADIQEELNKIVDSNAELIKVQAEGGELDKEQIQRNIDQQEILTNLLRLVNERDAAEKALTETQQTNIDLVESYGESYEELVDFIDDTGSIGETLFSEEDLSLARTNFGHMVNTFMDFAKKKSGIDKMMAENSNKLALQEIKNRVGVLGAFKETALISARIAQGEAIVSTAKGAAKAIEAGFPLGLINAALVIAEGAAQLTQISQGISQISSMPTTTMKTVFAAEGFDGVVDKPTQFIAGEAGRESVNITPLERDGTNVGTGGGGGASNITISGNVLSQEFVENELADMIMEAVNRGVQPYRTMVN